MEIQRTTCPSCGATLVIPDDVSGVTCDYCGSILAVTRSGAGVTLEMVRQVTESVAASGESTRSAIQDASQITQAELRRLQWTQELTATQLQLTNIRGEIRALEREKKLTPRARHQLQELRRQAARLETRVAELQHRLEPDRKPAPAAERKPARGSWGCAGILAGLGLLMLLGSLGAETSEDSVAIAQVALATIVMASLWPLFVKAGRPGWAAVVPFYNLMVWAEITGRSWWWAFLVFVPAVNLIVLLLLTVDLARSFGKGLGFAAGMVFLPFLFFPILAFSSAEYQGPAVG